MHKQNLAAIKESFGKVVYTHKTHEKDAEIQGEYANRLKWINLILLAATFGGLGSNLLWPTKLYMWSGFIAATFALGVAVFELSFNPEEAAERHRLAAKELWGIRERYTNLIADIKSESTSPTDLNLKRDQLINELAVIYKFAPATSSKAYQLASTALKINEEGTFNEGEVDKFLPKELWDSKAEKAE